jgi:hypothetical protein
VPRPLAKRLTARFKRFLRNLAWSAPVRMPSPGGQAHGPAGAGDPLQLIQLAPIDASGRWNVSLRDVSLRPYPFPYAAGFALANEYSYATPEQFEAVHAFVNGRGPTPFGDGLGLEVGDSVPVPGEGDLDLGPRLEQLAGAGWIDSLYAAGPTTAASLASALAHWPGDGRPTVYLGPTSLADRAVLSEVGVRFFSDDAWLEIDKFGDHHDHKVAERFQLAAADYDWGRWAGQAAGEDARADAKTLIGLMNETMPVGPREGGPWRRFKRYRGPWLPSMPTFSAQIASDLLDRLTQLAGVVVVQQQLGRWSLVGAADDAARAHANTGPALDRHALGAWREIAERNAAGLLWVATTSRLLDHLWRRQSLVFTVERHADKSVITLREMRCPVLGRRAIEPGDLNGLSFTVGEGAPEVVVAVAGWARPIEMARAADPAHRHRHAVYRPWTKLDWIAP